MIDPKTKLREMAPELLSLLEEEIELLRVRTRQFDELYDAILHRRDERMESLLEAMTDAQHRQVDLDGKLQTLRTIFARALGVEENTIRLSRLIDWLDGTHATDLRNQREQIILLAERLKKKHLTTAVLLSESARINRMLLEGLLPKADSVTTYGTGGTKPWQMNSGLVDAEM